VLKTQHPFVDWPHFKQFVNPTLSEDQFTAMTVFFNYAGHIVWFNVPGIRELVILDTQWLANLLASVVSFKSRSKWMLKRADLELAWKDQTLPPSIHDALIKLLERYDVLFPRGTPTLFPPNHADYVI